MGPRFHSVVFFAELVERVPFGRHQVGFVDGEFGRGSLEDENQAEVNLADWRAVIGNNSGEIERTALAVEMNFFFEFTFQAGVNDVLRIRWSFEVIDMAAHADGAFAVQTFFGLAAGAFHAEITIFVADDHVRDDLFVGWIVFSDSAAEERFVGENVIERALEVGAGEAASEQRIDAGGRDNEDVFVHGARG